MLCKTCKYWIDAQLVNNTLVGDCRWGPPTPMMIPQQHPLTGETRLVSASVLPKTGADFYCFQHDVRLFDVTKNTKEPTNA